MALNLPLYRILALPTSQRLRYILWSLDRVPLSLLYIPRPLAPLAAPSSKNFNTYVLNSWAPENIHGSSLRALYPLAARDYGEFSDQKDLLTFHLRTDEDLVLVSLAGDVPNKPRLELQTARGGYQILFHRPSTFVPATSYSLGKLLVIDSRSVAPEGRQCKDLWKVGCSFNVQEARAVGKFEWELSLMYDGAISALAKTDDENLCDYCHGVDSPEGSNAFLFQQGFNDAEEQDSWTSPLVTTLHLALPCEPPKTGIVPLARRFLLSGDSVFGMAGLPIVIGGICHFMSMVTFIIHNVRTGYSDLSILGKTSLYMWWVPLALMFIVPAFVSAIGGLILGTGYLMFGRDEKLLDFIARVVIKIDRSETVAWNIAVGLSSAIVFHWTCPFVAWVLFLCDVDNRPYRAVDLLFIASAGLYFFFLFSILGFVLGWTYVSRRLWIASHATNPSLAFSSPWKISSWRNAFSQGDWPANVVLLLRIDKAVRILADIWRHTLVENW